MNINRVMFVVRHTEDIMFGFKKERVAHRFFTQRSECVNNFGLTLKVTNSMVIEFCGATAQVLRNR
jgi:hypothetical protein